MRLERVQDGGDKPLQGGKGKVHRHLGDTTGQGFMDWGRRGSCVPSSRCHMRPAGATPRYDEGAQGSQVSTGSLGTGGVRLRWGAGEPLERKATAGRDASQGSRRQRKGGGRTDAESTGGGQVPQARG